MALRRLADMAYDDEEKYDRRSKGPIPMGSSLADDDDYPCGLKFYVSCDDLDKAGAGEQEPGGEMSFCAVGCVTSVYKEEDDCRVEIELEQFGGGEGPLFDLAEDSYSCVCLTGREMQRMDLDCDCEIGEYLCLDGEVKLVSVQKNKFGSDRACLQITELTYVAPEPD